VNDNAVEAMVNEQQQVAKQFGESSMANTRIKRGPGKRMVDGKSFRLADEVRYIQRRAADHTGRVISIVSSSCLEQIWRCVAA